jgi:hypothetical protein
MVEEEEEEEEEERRRKKKCRWSSSIHPKIFGSYQPRHFVEYSDDIFNTAYY